MKIPRREHKVERAYGKIEDPIWRLVVPSGYG